LYIVGRAGRGLGNITHPRVTQEILLPLRLDAQLVRVVEVFEEVAAFFLDFGQEFGRGYAGVWELEEADSE